VFRMILSMIVTALALITTPATSSASSFDHVSPRVQSAINLLAGQRIEVRCDITDGSMRGLSGGPELAWIRVAPSACYWANMLFDRSQRWQFNRYAGARGSAGDALMTLTHEAWHARRGLPREAWISESRAQCYALSKMVWFSRRARVSFRVAAGIRKQARYVARQIAEAHPSYAPSC